MRYSAITIRRFAKGFEFDDDVDADNLIIFPSRGEEQGILENKHYSMMYICAT